MGAHRYSASSITASPRASGEAYAELIAGAAKSISVTSITVEAASNLGGRVSLVRASAIGTGAATGIATGVAHITTSPAPSARLQVAWTSSGITPTGYVSRLRDAVLAVGTGTSKDLWDSERDGPLLLEPSTSLLLVNGGSGIQSGAVFVSATWGEGPT